MTPPATLARPAAGGFLARARGLAGQLVAAAQLVLWLYLVLMAVLGGWVALAWGVGGWSPVVVVSGSMSPAVDPGDVLLVERRPDVIGQRSILVFDRGGETIVHRVFSVEEGGYQTKGDANTAPDSGLVAPGDVIGVGRLLVPLLGLPVVWQQRGDLLPLGAWAVISLGGVVLVVQLAVRRRTRDARQQSGGALVAQTGIRRVRLLVALLIAAHAALDPARFDVLGDPTRRSWMIGTALVVLTGTNLVSLVGRRSPTRAVSPAFELVIDSALVVLLATFTGTSGIGWVLFALPIIEAAVRYRLTGALITWIGLTAVTLGARIWSVRWSGTASLLTELETLLDQLSLLFLVVVPTSYLAEQLMGDVAVQQRATRKAQDRSALLENVAQAGFRVTRLDGEPMAAIVEGTAALGFDAVDVVMSGATGVWQAVAVAGDLRLPEPGRPGSGLQLSELDHDAVVIDLTDPDPDEAAALAATGFHLVVAQTVSRQDNGRIVLRAGVADGRPVSDDQIGAFRLLAGQASIALQNDDLVRQLRATRDDLEHQAHHDALTGLPNRALLLMRVGDAMADDADRPALLFLDLNGFKPVNDRLGHDMGDALLRYVAQRLAKLAPEGCLVARLGGDEFTLLLPGRSTEADAVALVEAVWHRIREPYELNGDIVRISTSIGVAFGEPGMAHAELIRRADVAMYEAKHRSKDPARYGLDPDAVVYQIYRPDFDREEQRRGLLAAALPAALTAGELRVDYRPIVRLDGSGTTVGLEAMLRWSLDELGEVEEREIQEVAQSTGLRDALDAFFISEICRHTASWVRHDPDRPLFTLFRGWTGAGGQGLAEALAATAKATGLDPSRLAVEFGEQAAAEDLAAAATISALAGLGVGVVLGDFGQGRTPLSTLHQLPLTAIRVHPELVASIDRSGTDRIVFETIVQLARRLGLTVIAQGVATDHEVEALADMGCDIGQGPLLGLPELAADVGALLDVSRAVARPGPVGGR